MDKSNQRGHNSLSVKNFYLVCINSNFELNNMYSSDLSKLRITGALNNVQEKIQDGGFELRKNYPELGEFFRYDTMEKI